MTRKETMTSEERVWAAIRLEKPDRVPVNILAGPAYAQVTGLTVADWYANTNEDKQWASIDKVWDYTGGWDMDLTSIPQDNPKASKLLTCMSMGLKMKFPGEDLPENYTAQAVEQEVMTLKDYDTIAEIGWQRFVNEDYLFRIMDVTPEDVVKAQESAAVCFFSAVDRWKKRGVITLFPAYGFPLHPFFRFSVGRSMVRFMEDLRYHPALVEKALKTVTREYIEQMIVGCKAMNFKLAFVAEERAEAHFFPLPVFERFWWPYTQEIVDALWSEGLTTWFHLDLNWDKNIPYFKKLPRSSAILALDSITNIFEAKKVLRGHLCLAGDVPPALMCLGKPEDMEAYCKKLIDEVGGDGGFILGTGCEMPTAVKLDNWRAMIQTARNYELSKR
jgi:uroporphyrinogen-III decarboxylase